MGEEERDRMTDEKEIVIDCRLHFFWGIEPATSACALTGIRPLGA